MPRVVHFEIPADDPGRAIKFYQDVFGWVIEKWQGPIEYWLVMTGSQEPGIDGGIHSRRGPGGVVNSIDVPSVDEYVERVVQAGGKVVAPKMPVPGVGWMAYLEDTEGNQFSIIASDEAAE